MPTSTHTYELVQVGRESVARTLKRALTDGPAEIDVEERGSGYVVLARRYTAPGEPLGGRAKEQIHELRGNAQALLDEWRRLSLWADALADRLGVDDE